MKSNTHMKWARANAQKFSTLHKTLFTFRDMRKSILLATILFAALVNAVELTSPEQALQLYIQGIKQADLSAVKEAYDLHGQGFHVQEPLSIDSYEIKIHKVLSSEAASVLNKQGFLTIFRVGDVELEVELINDGKSDMYTYWLRESEGKWQLISHFAWDTPE